MTDELRADRAEALRIIELAERSGDQDRIDAALEQLGAVELRIEEAQLLCEQILRGLVERTVDQVVLETLWRDRDRATLVRFLRERRS